MVVDAHGLGHTLESSTLYENSEQGSCADNTHSFFHHIRADLHLILGHHLGLIAVVHILAACHLIHGRILHALLSVGGVWILVEAVIVHCGIQVIGIGVRAALIAHRSSIAHPEIRVIFQGVIDDVYAGAFAIGHEWNFGLEAVLHSHRRIKRRVALFYDWRVERHTGRA